MRERLEREWTTELSAREACLQRYQYRPRLELTEQLLTSLRERGMNLSGVTPYDKATETTRVLP